MVKFKIGWNDGHTLSGKGTGASGIIKETDRNRRIGALAKKYFLGYENVEIINCTIDKSENDLYEAVTKANSFNCNLFVSNHVNAGGGKGFETFYSRKSTEANIKAANIIHKQLVSTKSCLVNRRCCDDYSFLKYDLYVLINTKMDAVLCEIGFVDNKECISAVNEDEVARAYATGIAEAYGLKKKVIVTGNAIKIEESSKVEAKMDYIIQYCNSTDQAIAEVMADRLNCPTINSLRPYGYYGRYKTVIAVGEGKNKSSYTNVVIQGRDRKETLALSIEYCKKLGK